MKQWDTITGKYISQDGTIYAVDFYNQALPVKQDRTLDEIVEDLEKQAAHYRLMRQLRLPADEVGEMAVGHLLNLAKAVVHKLEGGEG